jgi:hypothetical protein
MSRGKGLPHRVVPTTVADVLNPSGQSPSLAVRRLLMMMILAAEAGLADGRHRLAKSDIRQGNKGNERLG